jgi:hypothetical protein
MSDDGNPAAAIISMFESSETFTLCADCLQGWTGAVLAGTAGVDPERFQAVFMHLVAEAETGMVDPAVAELLAAPLGGGDAGVPDGQDPEPAGTSDVDPTAGANGRSPDADAPALELVPDVSTGAPSDEPPAPAPADTDEQEHDDIVDELVPDGPGDHPQEAV